ncbi:hypothetical protein N7492_007902 [Penicillium capsulatum]|uniref:Uncharacterized protein n=1 Tax=Penicillium capsulatum TaxID=69766 RepID=A0A9W9I4W2_9EURO|nr:hypothetical protein N7492_007902 [Penicillium capsulatum]KAJ6117732.1 hypothetical protein N7512_007457 [Penicillium capsulatum]
MRILHQRVYSGGPKCRVVAGDLPAPSNDLRATSPHLFISEQTMPGRISPSTGQMSLIEDSASETRRPRTAPVADAPLHRVSAFIRQTLAVISSRTGPNQSQMVAWGCLGYTPDGLSQPFRAISASDYLATSAPSPVESVAR